MTSVKARASETTPLLRARESSITPAGSVASTSSSSTLLTTRGTGGPTVELRRILVTSFLLAVSFAFTQASLTYAMRTMTCSAHYEAGGTPPYVGTVDRCSIPAVEGKTARNIAIMGMNTTICSIVNLFVTSYWIKHIGVKAAMFQQTAWAAIRNLTQIYALTLGGATGIIIIQSTQLINIMGSAGGYQLAANSYIAILAHPEDRTKYFGILSGIIMLGASAGYTFGGLTDSFFGNLAPFQVTFALLVASSFFGWIFLPYIDPTEPAAGDAKTPGIPTRKSFLAPLKIFVPRKRTWADRRAKRDCNLFLLGAGAFTSVLATGCVPLALQLLGLNYFEWLPAESGFMLSLTLLIRAFFLTICFPRIIAKGRRHYALRISNSKTTSANSSPAAEAALYEHPEDPAQSDPPPGVAGFQPPQQMEQPPTSAENGSAFDLVFLRLSMFLDGLLTACVSFSSQSWHIFLAAAVLPFASGTGPAAKGVVLDFVEPDLRADALSAIALVEKLAQISTIGLFGYIFAVFSELEKPTLVFVLDAALAMLGGLLLVLVKVPETLMSRDPESTL